MATEQIKNLMEQVMKTGDPELMALLTEMLKGQAPDNASGDKNPTKQKEYPEFVMNQNAGENNVTGVPVNKMPRSNSFLDNGDEHKDESNHTPTIQPAERRRPKFTKVQQVCSTCKNTVEVHPQHAREYYKCDKCLRR